MFSFVLGTFIYSYTNGLVEPTATIADWYGLFLTVGLVAYAYSAISEAKKDRRRDSIEKMLSEVYSPLCEIFRRGRWDSKDGWRAAALAARLNKDGPRLFVLYHQEFARIREIVERFGHYIESEQREKLIKIMDDYDPWRPDITDMSRKPEEQTLYRFKNIETEAVDEYLRKRRDELGDELKELTEKA